MEFGACRNRPFGGSARPTLRGWRIFIQPSIDRDHSAFPATYPEFTPRMCLIRNSAPRLTGGAFFCAPAARAPAKNRVTPRRAFLYRRRTSNGREP
jgi:hypothetical protein